MRHNDEQLPVKLKDIKAMHKLMIISTLLLISISCLKPIDNFRYISMEDIDSATWEMATVDSRQNPLETGVSYSFYIGNSFFDRGI